MRLLAAVIALSLVARVAFIDEPCHAPCRSVADHAPIFDETYYLGAAHVIAGVAPLHGEQYGGAPPGVDPNSGHPQLAKLVIAASIETFGDGPLAWRLGSILAGTLAILGMFALVRAAGGSDGEAAVAAALMAADNLMIVHGRIGTLDAPALAAMVWSVALYLRGRPVVGGCGRAARGRCLREAGGAVRAPGRAGLRAAAAAGPGRRCGDGGPAAVQHWGGSPRSVPPAP